MTAPSAPSPQARDQQAHGHHALLGILRALIVGVFLLTFVAQPDSIPTGSMTPTLRIGDFVMVNKLAFLRGFRLMPPRGIQRGDIIVFRLPPDPARLLVKRVVAVPGDRIRLREGHVILNGSHVAEPYVSFEPGPADVYRDDFPSLHASDPDIDPAWWHQLHRRDSPTLRGDDVVVPAASYFVLGDNRNDSVDSRYWGFVPAAAIEGSPAAVYFALAADSDTHTSAQRFAAGMHAARILR